MVRRLLITMIVLCGVAAAPPRRGSCDELLSCDSMLAGLLGDESGGCCSRGCELGASAAPRSRQPLIDSDHLDCLTDALQFESDHWRMPVGAGAYHWFTKDLVGNKDGYGIPGLRDTYFWYLTADPQFKLGSGHQLGGHVELRLRERDRFRPFFVGQVWTYEAYVSLATEDYGTWKAGQIWKRFGMDWDGVWWGNTPYFDGFKLDPDYGIAWEKTTEVHDSLQVDSYLQFFFHEDRVNGSFSGADPESVAGYTERNTAVLRLLPRWTLDDGSSFQLGFSALVGEIQSRLANFNSQTPAAYAVDMNYYTGPWRFLLEGLQYFGRRNPARWVSGGPSTRNSDLLAGIHYTRGSMTYRCNYSCSLDSNPSGVQNLVVTGVTVAATKNVDLYLEYVKQQIGGNANPASDGDLFNSLNFILHWHI